VSLISFCVLGRGRTYDFVSSSFSCSFLLSNLVMVLALAAPVVKRVVTRMLSESTEHLHYFIWQGNLHQVTLTILLAVLQLAR